MTWKSAAHRAIKKELEPMRQATYWIIFVSSAVIVACLTVSSASAASMELINVNPDIASASWLVQ